MRRGELIKDRKRTKREIVRRRLKRRVRIFWGHYSEVFADLIFFLAFVLLLGSLGTIEISDGVPQSSVLIMAVSLSIMTLFAFWKMEN